MFSDIKMISFHFFLGIANGLGNEDMLNRLILINLKPIHHFGDSFASKYPEQIVFKGKHEL